LGLLLSSLPGSLGLPGLLSRLLSRLLTPLPLLALLLQLLLPCALLRPLLLLNHLPLLSGRVKHLLEDFRGRVHINVANPVDADIRRELSILHLLLQFLYPVIYILDDTSRAFYDYLASGVINLDYHLRGASQRIRIVQPLI